MRNAASKRNITAVLGATLAVGAVLAMAAGCSDDASKSDDAANTPATPVSSAQDYLSCLREHGVTITVPSGGASRGPMPSGAMPSGGPGGPLPSGVMPSGAPGGPLPSGAMPSGGPGGPGRSGAPGGMFGSQAPQGVDQQTWEQAQQACAALRPSANAG